MKRNLAAWLVAKHHSWRPHAKAQERPLAKMQIKAGAVGVCVQKTAEAEVMVAGGQRVYHQPSDRPGKLARVARRRKGSSPGPTRHYDGQHGVIRLAQAMNEARAATAQPRWRRD
jgi:D-serine deaminase-like pyridoxal phosphate-dependent protein